MWIKHMHRLYQDKKMPCSGTFFTTYSLAKSRLGHSWEKLVNHAVKRRPCFLLRHSLGTKPPASRCCRHSDSPLKMARHYLNGYLAGFSDPCYNTRGTLWNFPFDVHNHHWRLKISRLEPISCNKLCWECRFGKFTKFIFFPPLRD